MKAPHLNSEQFTAYLLDAESDPAGTAHLVDCAICREELECFKQSVNSFNSLTLAWSETRPPGKIRRVEASSRGWFPSAVWALAACLMLVVALSLALHAHRDRNDIASHRIEASVQDENSEAEIARDNQLMIEVNLEINRREQSPVLEYGLSQQTSGPAKMRSESRNE